MKSHFLRSVATMFIALVMLVATTNAMPVFAAPLIAPPEGFFQWPWALGQSWQATAGPHGTNLSGLDLNQTATGINSAENQEIRAAAGGYVTIKTSCYVVIDHGNGWSTGYVHIHPSVEKSSTKKINANDKIGVIDTHKATASCGGNGWSGPHLHFRLLYNGVETSIIGSTFGGWKVDVTPGYLQNQNLPSLYIKCGVTKRIYAPLDNAIRSCGGPAILQLSQGLSLSTTLPTRNQSVTASFKVKNVGGSPITLQTLSAGARRGSDWNGVNVDFPAATNITLQAGQEYSYQQSRSFDTTGAYFAEPVVQISGQWAGIPGSNGVFSRVIFNVFVTPPPDYRFLGNPSSTLRDNNGSADLTVCADNIVGRIVNVNFRRPDGVQNGVQKWKVWTRSDKATSRCITFRDLDGGGPLGVNTLYESRAALDQQPNVGWSNTSCYAGNSNQQGLCDTVRKNNQK